MALPVNTNVSSINAQRNLQRSTLSLGKSLERLSSGLRINRAGDDAAGLAISEGLRSQIRGLNQAVRNANDGLSLIGTAESAINTYTDILQRIRELAIQSANDTNSQNNRQAINAESLQLLEELQRIATTVEFNGSRLLDGTFQQKQLQVGAQANQTISIDMGNLLTNSIGKVATATGTPVPAGAAIGTGELIINGVDIESSQPDGFSTVGSSGSAIAIANAINAKTNLHNVTAQAQAAVFSGGQAIVAGTVNGTTEQLTINGINIFDTATTILADDSSGALRDAINAKSNQTGVVATLDSSDQLVLTAADGRNIRVVSTGTVGDHLGLTAAAADHTSTTGGSVRITSVNNITVSGSAPAKAGLTATTYTEVASTSVNYIDLSTVDGANLAIDIVDKALADINSIRAGLGAITNRLEMTVQNLQSISENLSASESRIRDADFAVETANLTRNQILQQAGIAILSQANTSTQSALQLLQG